MVDRSEDWLSKIERGERQARRLDVLADLARELRVTLGDLLGEPVLAEDDEQQDNVPAIRDVLMAPRRLSRVLYRDGGDAAPPPVLWASSMSSRRGATTRPAALDESSPHCQN